DVQFLDALLTFRQNLFSLCGIAFGHSHASILRPKLRAQLFRSPFTHVKPNARRDRDDYRNRKERDNGNCYSIHVDPSHKICFAKKLGNMHASKKGFLSHCAMLFRESGNSMSWIVDQYKFATRCIEPIPG